MTQNTTTPQPEIADRPAMKVLGVLVKSTAEEQDFGEFWDRFMTRAEEVEPFRIEPGHYGVDYLPDETGVFEYIPGIAVGDIDVVPEDLIVRDVPAGLYAAFPCRISTAQQTYGAIEQWLASSTYSRDESRPGLEAYASGAADDLVIYVPLTAA